MTTKVETTKTKGADFDAVVIGAGFGGLYAVHSHSTVIDEDGDFDTYPDIMAAMRV